MPMIFGLLLLAWMRPCSGWEVSVTDELIQLLQAPMTQQFESPAHMHRHVSGYAERLFDEKSERYSRQHSFIISLKENFDLAPLTSLLTRERLEVVGHRHYRVAMKPLAMKRFVDEHRESITSLAPLVSSMKIESSVYEMSSQCSPLEPASIVAETAALPQEELEAFQLWLDGMSRAEAMPFEYEKSVMQPETRRLVRFSTTCKDIGRLAKLLAENSEIVWIEKAKQMKHTNFWARGHASTAAATIPLTCLRCDGVR